MQGTATPKGTIMILHTDSKDWLQTAAMSGLLDPEVRGKVETVLKENTRLMKENESLRIWNRILEQNRRDNISALLRGYSDRRNEEERQKEAFHFRLAIGALAVALAITLTIDVCMLVL